MCQPAQATATAIAEALHVKLKPLRGMQNLNHGLWQGMCIDEVKRRQPTVYRQWQDQPESSAPPRAKRWARRPSASIGCSKSCSSGIARGSSRLVVPEPLASLVKGPAGPWEGRRPVAGAGVPRRLAIAGSSPENVA